MKESIEKFCRAKENGLFLLDLPTGFGKTYSVLEFIADNYDKPEFEDSKFFFVTTLKKNLPYEKLREHFAKRGKEKDYDALSIRIEANADVVTRNMELLYRQRKFPLHITSRPEFRELLSSVQLLNSYQDKIKGDSKKDEAIANLCKKTEDVIQKQQERAFRDIVVKGELKRFKSPMDKLKAIQNEPDFQWIGELYPAVFTREKKIFFMSMDKFILGNSTIIEPTYSFYNNPIIDKAVIFIDEFDSTRDRMLNQIIIRGLDNHVDYLTLFKQVQASLKTREFPTTLITDSKKQLEYLKEHPRSKRCIDIIKSFEEILDETYDKFSMQYSFRTLDGERGNNSRNFIFNDLQFHSVFADDNSFVQINTDKKANQNWLKFTKKRPTDTDSGILGLLSSVKGCVTYYENGCRSLAYNYKQLKQESENKRLGDDDFTLENAITSVLREFHLSRDYQRYLTPIILSGHVSSKKNRKDRDGKLSLRYFDRSIYDKGFRYYDFIDDPNHDMQSEIQLYDFPESPERILLKMTEKARVVGISATATLDTVIGNYDLDYLKRMLQSDYYTETDEDKIRLQEEFKRATKDYEKVDIHVEKISFVKENLEEELRGIFKSDALVKRYREKLENTYSGDIQYAVNQFMKIIKVMKEFILSENVKSFLCLSNKLAKDNRGLFDLTLLKDFADAIIKENKVPNIKGKDIIWSINGEEYDAKYKEMIEKLSNGEKLFVVSSYYTIGAGQNLQYTKPDNVSVVRVNDYERGNLEKDFDCIYLERPTNLLVNIDSKKALELKDMIRFVYQIEFLMDRGEISRNDGIACIKDAFICYSGGNKISGKKKVPYKTPSVNNYAIRTLIQAVGRICRTGLKNKDIYIYVDDDIFQKYDLTLVEQRMLNPEFRKIIEVAKEEVCSVDKIGDEIQILENAAGHLSIKTMQIINDLKRRWTDDSIDYWKNLRELCLMRPTMSCEEIDGKYGNLGYKMIYLKAPKSINYYCYEQEGDYNKNITIKFDNTLAQKMSEEDCGLKELLKIPGLKEYFEKKKYATAFVKNEYLLTPPMYNNIYKGALGEVVGKFIFERYLSVELKEVPEEYFERFDYTLENGIYIDFKLWKETMVLDAEDEKKKIIDKLDEVGGRRAIIVNIMYGRNSYPTTSYDGRIVEIPYLYRSDRHEIGIEMIRKISTEGYLL